MMNNEVVRASARVSCKKRKRESPSANEKQTRKKKKKSESSGSLFIFHEHETSKSVRAMSAVTSWAHGAFHRSDAISWPKCVWCWRNASANTKIEINNISRYRQPFMVLATSMKTNKMPNNNDKRKSETLRRFHSDAYTYTAASIRWPLPRNNAQIWISRCFLSAASGRNANHITVVLMVVRLVDFHIWIGLAGSWISWPHSCNAHCTPTARSDFQRKDVYTCSEKEQK